MRTLLSLILMTLFAPLTSASDFFFEQSVNYVDKSYGFSLDVPDHFHLAGEGPGLLYFQSSEKPGVVAIRTVPGMGLRNIQQLMRDGFQSNIIQLKTSGTPATIKMDYGQGMMMSADGTMEGRPISGVLAAIFGGNQQGYMVLVGAASDKWPVLASTAKPVIDSFEIRPIQPGHEHERWTFRLKGKHLKYLEGYGNYFEGVYFGSELHLCTDGRFLGKKGAGSVSYDPLWGESYSYSGSPQRSGTWQMIGGTDPYLKVTLERGGSRTAKVSMEEGNLIIGGRPFQVVPNTYCE